LVCAASEAARAVAARNMDKVRRFMVRFGSKACIEQNSHQFYVLSTKFGQFLRSQTGPRGENITIKGSEFEDFDSCFVPDTGTTDEWD
jgi:hypothetical protein